jgi:hypothetical protein
MIQYISTAILARSFPEWLEHFLEAFLLSHALNTHAKDGCCEINFPVLHSYLTASLYVPEDDDAVPPCSVITH